MFVQENKLTWILTNKSREEELILAQMYDVGL